jgi:hypothetical protein
MRFFDLRANRYILLGVIFWAVIAERSFAQQIELPMQRVDGFAYAGHQIRAIVPGIEDADGKFGDGEEIAVADSLADPAQAAIADPKSVAFVAVSQTATSRLDQGGALISASMTAVLEVRIDAGGFAVAHLEIFEAEGNGRFVVAEPDPPNDDLDKWIEGTISIDVIGFAGTDPDHSGGISGTVVLGQTLLHYESNENVGLLHVYGMLSDLDGLHPIDISLPGPKVLLTARQFLSADEDVEARSHHIGSRILGRYLEEGAELSTPRASAEIFFRAFAGIPGLPGDYNGDQVVDAADYTVWRNHLGESFQLQNEGVGVTEGMVTIEDYDFWKQRYGQSTSGFGGLSSVPEPTSCLLLIGLVSLSLTVRGVVAGLSTLRRERRFGGVHLRRADEPEAETVG